MNIIESSACLKDAVRAGAPAILFCDVADREAVRKATRRDLKDQQLSFQLAMGQVKNIFMPIDPSATLRRPDWTDELIRLTKSAGAARLIVCDLEGMCRRAGLASMAARDALIAACTEARLQIIV